LRRPRRPRRLRAAPGASARLSFDPEQIAIPSNREL
jgi:hypothetical protein